MISLVSIFQSPGPELLKLGPFNLRWYGVLIAISVFIGLNLSTYLAKKKGLNYHLINEFLPLLILSAIIGARTYYVVLEWPNYNGNLLEILAIWRGGIAIHGALIGGTLALIAFCRSKRQPFWEYLDVIFPSVILGQSIGRWGNFFNNEAFGLPTNLPWKLYIPSTYRPSEFFLNEYFHPTFLYESLWDFSIFILLISLIIIGSKHKLSLHSGSISCLYILLYSIGRFWIEALRTDPLCIGSSPPLCEGGIRAAQLISLILIIFASSGIFWIYRNKKGLPSMTSKISKQIK